MSLQRARGAFLKIAARFMGCTRSTFRIRLLSDIKVYVQYQKLRFIFGLTLVLSFWVADNYLGFNG